MSELRKAQNNATYFLTLTTVGWIDVFNRQEYINELINNLKFCQDNKGLELFAYVIMSSHIHLVARREGGKLNELLRDFKSFTAKRIIQLVEDNNKESRKEWMLHLFKYYAKYQKQNTKYQFWQKTNHPIELFSAKVIQQKIDYIHQNPVETGIVNEAQNYIYSSANPFSEIKTIDP